MTSPAPATTAPESDSRPVARRSKRVGILGTLLVALAVAATTTACTPEQIAKDAIKKSWGSHAACAERIVHRESRFQADAVNRSSGATGLFQLMPMHADWIKRTYGYDFSEMKDPYKNAEVAKGLSAEAYRYWGDGWQPWRLSGRATPGGGCPA